MPLYLYTLHRRTVGRWCRLQVHCCGRQSVKTPGGCVSLSQYRIIITLGTDDDDDIQQEEQQQTTLCRSRSCHVMSCHDICSVLSLSVIQNDPHIRPHTCTFHPCTLNYIIWRPGHVSF